MFLIFCLYFLFIYFFVQLSPTDLQRFKDVKRLTKVLQEEGKKTFFSGYSIIQSPYAVWR